MSGDVSDEHNERFLRDGELKRMIDEVRSIMRRISKDDPSQTFLYQYVYSLYISFKTKVTVLERLEESIEFSRRDERAPEIYRALTKAAGLIRRELAKLYKLLITNTELIDKK